MFLDVLFVGNIQSTNQNLRLILPDDVHAVAYP